MTILYSALARIYHEMYQRVFDYDKEYSFYDSILKRNNCQSILEVGCGSGMLARRFLRNGYKYPQTHPVSFRLTIFKLIWVIAQTHVDSKAREGLQPIISFQLN